MPATVEEAVCARLKAVAAVNDAVSGRIFPVLDTQEPTFPQIVYTKLAADSGARLDGSRALKRYTVRVDVYAETEAAADTIGKAVRDAITPDGSPWQDTANGVHGAFFEDSVSEFTEDGIRVQGETFGVWFRPTS